MKNQLKLSKNKFNQKLLATTNQLDDVLSPIPDNSQESPCKPPSQADKDDAAYQIDDNLSENGVDPAA